MLKDKFGLVRFSLIISLINLILYHYPFFKFVITNIDYKSFNGILLVLSLIIAMFLANAFVIYLFFFISRYLGKFLFIVFFIINSVAIYFINTYGVIIDESMIGNIFNTNSEESTSFFSFKLIIYVVLLGVLPSIFILKKNYIKESFKPFIKTTTLALVFLLILVLANASNWLWIDKNSKRLGGLAMPWSYTVNTVLYFKHQAEKNRKEILLPDAQIINNEKSVVVLMIGESARSQNFSLYGYDKNTNPLLKKLDNLHHFYATSCATYTTEGVKCILSHNDSKELYEVLPNYLNRNNVDVIWRTTNWGEPPIRIDNYQNRDCLRQICKGNCDYDEVLLAGLKEQILNSKSNKVLVVLHMSTSHGPTYNKKYPAKFEVFKPVCESVELGNCTNQELVNAYDNTIVYTDYLINRVVEDLLDLKEYKSAMLFVSDHGESLGEKNLYMHGVPRSIAPKEQYEIPFLVWFSDDQKELKPYNELNQNNVFHSVMNFLGLSSPIYNEDLNVFKAN